MKGIGFFIMIGQIYMTKQEMARI